MMALFTDDGTVKPIKFKIKDAHASYRILKIDKIVAKNLKKIAGNKIIVFGYQSEVEGIKKIYEVKYELGTYNWTLFKIYF